MRLLGAKSDNSEFIRLGMSRRWLVNTVRLPENDLQVKGIRKDMYEKGLVMKKGFMRNQGRVKRNFFLEFQFRCQNNGLIKIQGREKNDFKKARL